MTTLQTAALWIGINLLFLTFVSMRVGLNRVKHKVNLGDGGNDDVFKAIRVQGNYVEYAPLVMIGLLTLAFLQVSSLAIHLVGGFFFLARVFHFLGLGTDIFAKGRLFGTLGTILTCVGVGLYLIYKAIS